MQEYEWLKLDPRGTVSLNVSNDPDTDDWVTLRLPKISDIKRFGIMLEDADQITTEIEARARELSGLDQGARDLLELLKGDNPADLPMEAVAQAPDALKIEREYIALIQRFLMSDDNPYPKWYSSLIEGMSDRYIDPDDLPGWALQQPAASAIIAHFQQAPLALGMRPGPNQQADQTASAQTGNRAARRQTARTR